MLIFHAFTWPLLFSMTFRAWKMLFLNSRTFHDFPGPVVTLILTPGFPLFHRQKKIQDFSRTFQDPIKNFPGPFWSPQMFKYKEKTAFTYNIQSVVHCRKFSMKQNVDVSCSEFRWTYLLLFPFKPQEKCMTFNYIFPGLSRTLSFNFQDFPGPVR